MNKIFVTVVMSCILFMQSVSFAQIVDTAEPTAINSTNASVLPYDFTSTRRVPIELTILDEISTKNPPNEGDIVNFRVHKNVFYKRKLILKAGDVVPARIENIITSGMNGFPAEIVVDDFQLPGIKQSQLISEYTKKGQNRCYVVYPLKWALTLIPFVGSLTNFIMGGHAKIKTSDIVTVYYYPQW